MRKRVCVRACARLIDFGSATGLDGCLFGARANGAVTPAEEVPDCRLDDYGSEIRERLSQVVQKPLLFVADTRS